MTQPSGRVAEGRQVGKVTANSQHNGLRSPGHLISQALGRRDGQGWRRATVERETFIPDMEGEREPVASPLNFRLS